MSRGFWNVKANQERLRKLYPAASRAEILAAFPGRTWNTIIKRAGEIGVSRSKSASPQGALSTDPIILALRRRRVELGLKMRDVAKAAGYAVTTLRAAESGRTCALLPVVRDWAAALGLTLTAPVTGPPLAKEGSTPPERKRAKGKTLIWQQAAKDMEVWSKRRAA